MHGFRGCFLCFHLQPHHILLGGWVGGIRTKVERTSYDNQDTHLLAAPKQELSRNPDRFFTPKHRISPGGPAALSEHLQAGADPSFAARQSGERFFQGITQAGAPSTPEPNRAVISGLPGHREAPAGSPDCAKTKTKKSNILEEVEMCTVTNKFKLSKSPPNQPKLVVSSSPGSPIPASQPARS